MTEVINSTPSNERISRESPQLVALLKEMKEGLDNVRNKIQTLTAKLLLLGDKILSHHVSVLSDVRKQVKEDHYPTSDGLSYLETKHLLLLNYCQTLVYLLLHKAKGLSIQGHPVVRSLVETRLFLEKIRPVDRKLEYQIQKLTKATAPTVEKPGLVEKEQDETQKTEDLLKYRPNADLLIPKTNTTSEGGGGVYRPPKFAPSSMGEEKMSKQERNALRKDEEITRKARQSEYVRDLMNEVEGRPEEIRENVGTESREATQYIAKMEERARQEEDLFTRAPLSKAEKRTMKHFKKSRNGMLDLTESFYDEIKTLPLEGSAPEQSTIFNDASGGDRKFKNKKHKRKH